MAENIENSSYEEIIKKADEFSKQKNYKEEIKLYKIAMVMFADKLDKTKLISLYIKLGNAYYNLDNRDKSTQYYEEYLKLHPQGQSSVFSRLSHAYYYTDTDKSIDYHNKALNLQPNKYDVTSKLFAMTKSSYYDQQDVKDESEYEAESIKNNFFRNIKKYTHEEKKKKPNKKLNIAYLSSDCYTHTMMSYMLPIWENHNKEEFNFFIFIGTDKHDSTTEKIENLGFKMVNCHNMPEADIAKAIYDNKIDILVELGGYTHLKSFCTFYKPAPIIISYLGYLNTLGIKEVDYILADRFTIPEEYAYLYTEKPLYLDKGYTIFAKKTFPDIEDCPFEKNGYTTYGCFNCTSKLSDASLYMWSKILEKDKDSRLLIYRTQLTRNKIKAIKNRLSKYNADLDRVIFMSTTYSPHFKAYSNADILLDPYPFSGMSISMEAAMMGVPVVTLIGEGMQSRGAGRMNKVLGLEELIAENGDEYIEKAIKLSSNKERIKELRQTLRSKLENSPIISGHAEFTKDLEEKYKKVWKDFVNSP